LEDSKLILVVICLCLTVVTQDKVHAYTFPGGSGNSGSPFQIQACTDLQNMSTNLTAYYVLDNNIDCTATSTWNSGAGFTPVGNNSTNFAGNFKSC
jgi:hypothetical protein